MICAAQDKQVVPAGMHSAWHTQTCYRQGHVPQKIDERLAGAGGGGGDCCHKLPNRTHPLSPCS